MAMKIVVGVDGSEHSMRAVAWCAKYGVALEAEVVAVHAIEMPVYPLSMGFFALPEYTETDHEKLAEVVSDQWCEPLRRAGVRFHSVLAEGYPTNLIREAAENEDADLVVVGSRGLGGFTGLLLGSTSHFLSHHLDRPLVIVP
jgi:nucleotide-binding universal stress UspA family protein